MRAFSGVLLLFCLSTLPAADADRVARGKYVFTLADCSGCHSERDFSRFSAPVVPDGIGKGTVFPPELGLPGKVVAPNITPDKETGIGAWTDAEKIRAIRDGIAKDRGTLFPFMPYPYYRHMSDADVQALVAYINTLKPIANQVPRTELPPEIKLPPPQPAGNVPEPDRTNKVKYGEYLVTVGVCADCHTAQPNGKRFAGGHDFRFPGGLAVRSSNITPDPETGIGKWTENQFVKRFQLYRQWANGTAPQVGPERFTIMPWIDLSQLDPDDLRAMYAYLRTVPAVRNRVELHPAVPSRR